MITNAQMQAVINAHGSVIWPPMNGAILTTIGALPTDAQIATYFNSISTSGPNTAVGTLQNAATATGVGATLSSFGLSSAIFSVSGTFVGTVQFEGLMNGRWETLLSTMIGTAVIGTSTTVQGSYEVSLGGATSAIRANITAYTSGSITVAATAALASFAIRTMLASLNTLIAGEDQANNVLKVEERFSPITPITTATTTTIKSGAGFCHHLRCAGGTLGNVTVYDNTAGSGTVLFPTLTPIAGQLLIEDITFAIGLTVVTAAATAVVGSIR